MRAEIVLGISNLREFEPSAQRQSVEPSNWIIHPGWDPSLGRNDIALIRLDTPLEINDNVKIIGLPDRSDASVTWEGETGIAAGWGKISDDNPSLSDELRWVESDIESNSHCNQYYPGLITANHLCASGAGGRSVCDGKLVLLTN